MTLRWPAVLAAIVLGALIAAACGGDDGGPADSSTPTTPAGSVTPATAEDAYILYREASGNIIAQNLATGLRYHQEVDFTTEAVVGVQCAPGGSRIVYLRQVFSEQTRQAQVRGEGAPDEPLVLSSQTQGVAWSPDATQLAVSEYDGFSQQHTLSVLDIATGESTVIGEGMDFIGSLSWSPDGERLAYYFQSVTGEPAQVFVRPIDGGDPVQVSDPDRSWYDPVWSPDGNRLLVAGLEENNFQLYALDPDGVDDPVQLTDSDVFKRGPGFSPGGTTIAYTGSIVLPSVSTYALHSFAIFLADADGSNERSFTADPRDNPDPNVDPFLDAYFLGWCAPGPWLDDLWVAEQ